MKYIIFAFLALFSTSAHAEPAVVKSGEHSKFSRLVLYTGSAQVWDKKRDGRVVTITLNEWTSGYDLSEAFDFIPRSRISSLRSTPSGIEIFLACDCSVEVESIDSGGLKIDVADEDLTKNQASPPFFGSTDTTINTWPKPEGFLLRGNPTRATSKLRARLSEKIGKSASQGILEALVKNGVKEAQESPPPDIESFSIESHERTRTTSATERALRARAGKDATRKTNVCPPKKYGDINNWGTDEPFTEQLSELRRTLFGEFDQYTEEQVVKLAQLYLFFTMGAEAEAVLQGLGGAGAKVQFLKEISFILDTSAPFQSQFHLPQNGCGGMMSIWAALSHGPDMPIHAAQAKIISESFTNLPHHLKTHLGPPLISRMNLDGQKISASIIQNSLTRESIENPYEVLSHSKFKALPEKKLRDIIKKNVPDTPFAILALLDQAHKRGEAIDSETRHVAESFSIQLRGEPVAEKLLISLTKDTAIMGDHSVAMKVALDIFDFTIAAEVTSFIVDNAVTHAENVNLALFIMSLKKTSRLGHVSSSQILKINERLDKMGLPDLLLHNSPMPTSAGEKVQAAEHLQRPIDKNNDTQENTTNALPSPSSNPISITSTEKLIEKSHISRENILSKLKKTSLQEPK